MLSMRILLVVLVPVAIATGTLFPRLRASRDVPLATAESYRTPAGRLVGDTLVVTLEAREARWQPQGAQSVALPVYVFAEPGQAPRVPGPMLRVPEGGVIRLTLRNVLPKRLVVRGLVAHPTEFDALQDSVPLEVGRDTTIVFSPGAAGSYVYWGRTTPTLRHRVAPVPDWMWGGEAEEGPFIGVIIVDKKGTVPDPRERTFLITRWLDEHLPRLNDTVDWKIMVNGGSYPNTEPLSYTVGDTVRWRVINATLTSHPMHLHGFYFRTTGKGDITHWSDVPVDLQRSVVTEFLDAGETMTMAWVPERPGNWLFHCHLTRHMTAIQNLPSAESSHAGHDDDHSQHMAGLVMGVTVKPMAGARAAITERQAAGAVVAERDARTVRLFAQQRANGFGSTPRFAFVAQQGARAPARDSVTVPSAPLILKRGQQARIVVHNRLDNSLSVHWHGMELESWYDGVGGFSGMGSRMKPSIAPRDSFVVRFTPPRAGTFMMHTHDELGDELASGLYGTLLVLDDPAAFDPVHDHVVLLAKYGPGADPVMAVNGSRDPAPLALVAGDTHRLRFASIPSNERVEVSLVKRVAGDTSATVRQWTVVAVDGADLPADQRRAVAATRFFGAGMTMDVQFVMPNEAGLALRVRSMSYEAFDVPERVVYVPLVPRGR
jgi:FtsP/CotA-like multicopper oxidase with cupredoxin domain